MSIPVLGPVAGELYDEAAPLAFADEANGWPLAHLCEAAGRMLQPVEDLARDTDDAVGWSGLVDADRTPATALPYLAQFVGARLIGSDESSRRDQIRNPAGFKRGRLQPAIDAAKLTLTGQRVVRVVERASSAWTITFVTRPGETPDPAAFVAVLMRFKPAGIVMSHVITDAPIVDEGTRTIDASTGTIDAATLGDIT